MIVTMMFAQVAYLLVYYFGAWTRGDEGLVIQQQARAITLRQRAARPHRSGDALHDGARPLRHRARHHARASCARPSAACWSPSARTRSGRRCSATTPSPTSSWRWWRPGAICAAAGAAYVILFGYVGSTLASVQYSILPLLWVLARRRGDDAWAASRHVVHVLRSRHHQRLHLGLHADRRRRADPARALFSERHTRHDARPLGEVAAMTPLLTTRGLSRYYGGLKAVDGVDFAVMPGEIRAIIGPNGAGKTTFVSLVCGRVEPSAGMIVFDGSDITDLPPHQRVRRGIAYTFQITSVFANLSAYDNVALPVQRTLTDGRATRRGAFRRDVGAGACRARRTRERHRRDAVLRPPAAARSGDGAGAEAETPDPRRADARTVRRRDRELHRTGARDRARRDGAA